MAVSTESTPLLTASPDNDGSRHHPVRIFTALAVLAVIAGVIVSVVLLPSSSTWQVDWLSINDPLFVPHRHHHAIRKRLEYLDSVMTGSVEFDAESTIFNQAMAVPSFATVHPVDTADVQLAVPILVELERHYDIPWAIQAGGHNYAGWSQAAIVLSLKQLKVLIFDDDSDSKIVTFGPGITDGDILLQGLLQRNLCGAVGSSSEVSMGGWILGGGLAFWSRAIGLGIDNVLDMQVVLANGTLVTASSQEHPDLFWALQGAGQNNFGVVTQFRYQLYKTQDTQLMAVGVLPYESSAHFLTKLGNENMPGNLFVEINSDDGNLTASLFWFGENDDSLVDGEAFLANLLQDIFPQPVADGFEFSRFSWYQSAFDETEEFKGLMFRDWNGFLMRNSHSYEHWELIVEGLHEAMESSDYVLVDVESFGGKIGEVDPNATAFYWREGLYNVGFLLVVPADLRHADKIFEQETKKLDKIWRKRLAPLLQGTFTNYAMESLDDSKDFAEVSWGENLDRLQEVKLAYDPENAFHRPQSIPMPKKSKIKSSHN